MAKVKGSKNWTKGEVQILLRMAKDGVSVNGISDSIGRSPAAVYSKLSSIRHAVRPPSRKKVAVETPAASETIANTTRGRAQQAEEAPVISTFSNEQKEEIVEIAVAVMTELARLAQDKIAAEIELTRLAREKIVAERQAKKKRGFFSRVSGSKHD